MIRQEKKNIGLLFDNIAKHYDFLNHLLSFNIDKSWRRKAIRELKPSDNLLDVATGTGDFVFEILIQNKAKHITGMDISREMLALGEKKISDWQNSKGFGKSAIPIQLKIENVLNLSFPNNSFDAVTCAFGVRNFADLDVGLKEMYRVLKDNGQIVILEFSHPKNFFIKFFYNFYFSVILPLIGRIVSKDKQAYKYLYRSVRNFSQREEFLQHLKTVGFKNTGYKQLSFGICTVYKGEK